MKRIYNKLDKPTRKAQKRHSKYLGQLVSKFVSKNIEGLHVTEYSATFNYVRTGMTIVLYPDEEYQCKFGLDENKIFGHHLHDAYLYLTKKLNRPFFEKRN